ncbi:superoxide dismutase, partial [Cladochytrium replicatum]
KIKGLASATKYGVHIHQWGQLSEDGMTSGSHYNPLNRTHSCPSSDFNADSSRTDLHVGDIVQDGGLTTDSTGALQDVTVRSKLPSLNILDPSFIIGRTIIIHERLDDCTTQPTGNSGKRIAQGVIGATD